MSIEILFRSFSVLTDRLSRPKGKGAEKRADLLITEQKRDILGGHVCVGKIAFRKQFPRMVQLLLKIRIFLLQLALQLTSNCRFASSIGTSSIAP